MVHHSIVDAKSPWLWKAFVDTGDGTGDVRTSETDAATFQAYVHWMYTSEIDENLLPGDENTPKKRKPTWPALVELWDFASLVEDNLLCNKLIDIMLDKFDSRPGIWFAKNRKDADGLWDTFNIVFDSQFGGIHFDVKIQQLFCDMLWTGVHAEWQRFDPDLMTRNAWFHLVLRSMTYETNTIADSKDEREGQKVEYHIPVLPFQMQRAMGGE